MIKIRCGFTIVELLLSVAIISIIFGLSIPFYQTFYINSGYNTAISDIRQNIYRAEARARNSEQDSIWSLRIQNNNIYIYLGNDFANRNSEYDEIIEIAGSVTIEDIPDIHFAKLSGIPNESTDIVINSISQKSKTISINSQGGID
ncbi:Tfp pilus assembly protein FimT/FimU [Patescibacteria group bacterium]